MKEISLHILDIVQNSITADATLVDVSVDVRDAENRLTVSVRDNGRGMGKDMLEKVTSPFVTTRVTRSVGLGIPLFAAGAQNADGSFLVTSEPGKGTCVTAVYALDHIDRPPIGDFSGTMRMLIISNPNIDFITSFSRDGEEGTLDTREVRRALSGVPLDNPDVSLWIKESLDEIFPPAFAEI